MINAYSERSKQRKINMKPRNIFLILSQIMFSIWVSIGLLSFVIEIRNRYTVILQVFLLLLGLFFYAIHRKMNKLPVLAFLHTDDEEKNRRNRRAIICGIITIFTIFIFVMILKLLEI